MKHTTSENFIPSLLQLAKRNQIKRREFIQAMMMTGVTLSSASTLWTNHVLADSSGAPKKGGKFRLGKGHGATSDTLDPALNDNGFLMCLVQGMNNYLTEVDNSGSLQAELATDWEPSEDASTWTFQLRQGVMFHNGQEVTADDVIASINHHRGADSQSAVKPLVEPIVDIKPDGPHTVVFELNGGNADFPFIMSDYHFPIMPANSDGTLDWQSGIGCGAYKLKGLEPGVRADFERNQDYWKTDRAHFDEIEMLVITDPASRTNALVSGEVDAIDKVDLKTVHLLKQAPGIHLHQVTGTLHYTFAMHTDVAPFDNNDVRLALKYAINRDEIIEKVLQGFGSIGNDHPIGSGQRFFAKDLEQTTYDPERAREHLKKAGMENLTVDLHVADAAFNGAVDAGLLYSEHAKAAGITINIVREPNDGYWSDVWLQKPFTAVFWSGRPTEDWMFATTYAAGGAWNDTHFDHPRFNELLLAARSELNESNRYDMYAEMQSIVNRDGGTIVPMFASYVFATSDKIGHAMPLATNWDSDGERSMERWWFV